MSLDIKVFIDDKECSAKKGETLLNIARNNGINIPTLCDLKKLTPTGACRMCVVEEENGNIIASCKSVVNKDSRFYTNTTRLQKYRNQIMSFLCINHPLECGVCDKSGECELQDKVLESKVDIQPFFAIQKQNDYVSFHNKIYNESLCIMCERCARTCNEFVGNNVLSVLAGGFHSKIGVDFNAYCEDCDECVSVCPTGAMFSSRFTYTSNAWELEKVESFCLHCSLRCELEYEVKHNIDSRKEVYRIKNKAHINQLCHAGRHNFIRQNPFSNTFLNNMKYENNLRETFDISKVLNTVNAIRINSNVTNEEAYIANMLAKKSGKKLYCNEALQYKEFCNIANIKQMPSINNVRNMQPNSIAIILGSYLYDEIPVLRSDLSKNALKRGSKNIWISTIAEERFKSDLSLKYEVGAELGIVALLLSIFEEELKLISDNISDAKLLKDTLIWLQELDLGNIIAESNVSEHELECLRSLCLQTLSIVTPDHSMQTIRNDIYILVGQDFYLSSHYRIIAQILGIINNLCNVSIIPLAYHNINGIQEICDLEFDNFEFNSVLGIRCNAEYSITTKPYIPFINTLDSSNTESNVNIQKHCYILPLQFMEGSVIDMDYKLSKLQPSYVDDGFGGINDNMIQGLAYNNPNIDLLDICKDYLGLTDEYIIDITPKLPFKLCDFNSNEVGSLSNISFDDLDRKTSCNRDIKHNNIAYMPYPKLEFYEGSGIFIYRASISGNFSFYSNEYDNSEFHGILNVSNQFCIATKLQDNEIISLQVGDYVINVKVIVTSFLKGMVAVLVSDCITNSNKYFDYKRLKV